MLEAELRAQREAVVTAFGPWIGYNIDLGAGVYTMAPGLVGMAEERVKRVVQLVADFAPRPLPDLRILDLGAHEAGFAIELARRGAEVIAVEPRDGHVAKASFVKQALGLDRLRIVQGNARDITTLVDGRFDVVLCLGLLYHLDAEGACSLLHALRPLTESFAIIETQIALTGRTRFVHRGNAYLGLRSPETPRSPGAAIDVTSSFWLTKPSLLNLLTDAGFSSVVECLNPVIPDLAAFRDHVTFVAAAGDAVDYLGPSHARWPERLSAHAAPSQGLRWAMLDRLRSRRGGGMRSIFTKRRG